ncbi:MAG TPA: hypothetical protein VNM89_06255, partial [Solirubrobacterales bacterium]|nr:hypothetical protein [Solirubrobacterales bacterium]
MGFLSRKSKSAPASDVVEEAHPIVEELQEMEQAVPQRLGPPAERPVASPAPPAGEASEGDDEPARVKAHDLIAPSRHEVT